MKNAISSQPRPPQANPEPTSQAPRYAPRFDIVETENELTLQGDMPGVKESDLDVRYEDDRLVISGKVTPRQQGVAFLRQEYGVGDYYRTFSIGESIDTEKITAELHNGVLVVHLPKTEVAKPKRIAVKAV